MDGIKNVAEAEESAIRKFVGENYYKVRDCDFYEMEYKECKSIKGRFQQYYVYGELFDCSKWKEDLHNCNKFKKRKDLDVRALASIIQHEDERMEKRKKANQANDVWKKRSEPPADWNAELPEWLERRQEYAFTGKKDTGAQLCIIS